jgi:CRISPR-associated protein Csd1
MILQALAQYYQRLVEEGNPNVALAGFEKKAIPFLIVLNSDGKLIGIDDTRTLEGRKKKARSFIVPKIFQGSRTVNVKANLLWDKASYVFGVGPKTKPERLPQQRRAFKNTILEYFPDKNTSVHAVLKFLEDYSDISKYGEGEELSKTDPYVAFRLNGKKELICNSSDVLNRVENRGNTLTSIKGGCLVTGYYSPLTRLENPLKGLLGSKKAESHLVAFNDESYWSYGKKYGANAPISESASLAYVSALRFLQLVNFSK